MTEEVEALRARLRTAEQERDEFKRIGQDFERDSRKFFEQSCKNLSRAQQAEAALAQREQELAALQTRLAQLEQVCRDKGPELVSGVEVADALHAARITPQGE